MNILFKFSNYGNFSLGSSNLIKLSKTRWRNSRRFRLLFIISPEWRNFWREAKILKRIPLCCCCFFILASFRDGWTTSVFPLSSYESAILRSPFHLFYFFSLSLYAEKRVRVRHLFFWGIKNSSRGNLQVRSILRGAETEIVLVRWWSKWDIVWMAWINLGKLNILKVYIVYFPKRQEK